MKTLTPTKKILSSGVIVTDGDLILLGHVTNNRHWDIPKGQVDPGESTLLAAIRELKEETGILVGPDELRYAGMFPYQKRKDLALWVYDVSSMPDANALVCTSEFVDRNGESKKEIDAFLVVTWEHASMMVAPNLWKVLALCRPGNGIDGSI